MAMARDRVHTTVDALSELSQRSRADVTDRGRRVRGSLLLAAQAGVAAGLAWLVARDVVGHPQPVFAPIAAVIVLNVCPAIRAGPGLNGPPSVRGPGSTALPDGAGPRLG